MLSSNKYTVVIPVYNSEKSIDECINSVFFQTYKPYEIILIDDHSTDSSVLLISQWTTKFEELGIIFRYILLDNNSGPSIARNIGIKNSSGNFIAFLDSDDYWSIHKLKIINSYIEKDVGIIFHQYSENNSKFIVPELHYKINFVSNLTLVIKNIAQTSCVVMNKKYISYFNENMKYCEDYDLWLRVSEKAKVIQLIGPPLTFLGRPQLSKGGLSGNRYAMRLGEIKVYYNFCKRSWFPRFFALPFLITFSIFKHCFSYLKMLN